MFDNRASPGTLGHMPGPESPQGGRRRATPQPSGRGRVERGDRIERAERLRAEAIERGQRLRAERIERVGRGAGRGGRARAQLSLDALLAGAIEILDADGESGLTLRGLAARLGGGVGSLYWYVRGKEQLLDLATDAVIGHVMDDIDAGDFPETDDIDTRLASLREIGLILFRHLEAHSWAASFLLRDSEAQPNSLRYFDMTGRQLIPLGLTNQQMFHGASAIINYVVGMGAQMAVRSVPLDANGQPLGQDEFFEETVTRWAQLDRDEYPFMHRMIDEFRDHDDLEQFTAGLDLIIDGLRRQGETARP